MLILTRKLGESILIGDDITIKPLSFKGNQIRLGIKAPKSIAVHREEVYQRIQSELSNMDRSTEKVANENKDEQEK